MKRNLIYAYTDGSCRKNPGGPGGFGVVVVQAPEFTRPEDGRVIDCYSLQTDSTTNNREEMKAIIWAMTKYGRHPLENLTIITDSSYSLNTFTNWMKSWKDHGWMRGNGSVPENLDLVQNYDNLLSNGYRAEFIKVAGHKGNLYNEIADKLATNKVPAREVMRVYGNT